jgi:hypothetical protein
VITIPTGDFTGLLSDIAAFVSPYDDLPDVNVVRLEWDGEMLHAWATDTMRSARTSWHPDDDPDTGSSKDTLFAAFGGADEPWTVFITRDDAIELVKHFKLPAKEAGTPLVLDHRDGQLRVVRSGAGQRQALTATLETATPAFPNLRKELDADVVLRPVDELPIAGRYLADIGSVRQRGTLTMHFAGPGQTVRITIGDRFVAVIPPLRTKQPAQPAQLETDVPF